MKKVLSIIVLIITVHIAYSQTQTDSTIYIDNPALPTTKKEINNNPNDFQFVIVSDRTGGHRPGVFGKAIDKINLLQPEFIMSVGDLIEGYTEDLDVIESEWQEFDSLVNRADMRFYYVAGNHDMTNKTMGDVWKDRLGPQYYYFIYKNTLFLCLNSESRYEGSGKPYFSKEQFDYFQEILTRFPDVRWTFVFMHQPLWIHKDRDVGYWQPFAELLNQRKHSVFAGHVHQYVHYTVNNRNYVTLGTTGGGSRLRGKAFGEVDHLTWVTLKGKQPIYANIMIDSVEEIDFATKKSIDIFREMDKKPFAYIENYDTKNLRALDTLNLIVENRSPYNVSANLKAISNSAIIPRDRIINVELKGFEKGEIKIPIRVLPANRLIEALEYEMEGSLIFESSKIINWSQIVGVRDKL